MISNYIKTAIRSILRNKIFSLINITGLSIGLACFILIFLWVKDEIGYDRFHENADQLFRINTKDHEDPDFIWTTTPTPLAPLLKEKFPEVISYTRYWSFGAMVRYEEKHFFEDDIKLVDPYFFEMFTFPFVKGEKETALPNLDAVVLTESTARKYFGDEDPIGKMLNILNYIDLTVTAVIKDPPKNSHMRFTMLAHMDHVPEYRRTSWASDYPSYIMIHDKFTEEEVNQKIEGIWRTIDPDATEYPVLQNVTEIYLNENGVAGKLIHVYTFSIIAILVLIIACINFMNLSTARSAKRAREVGLRKIVGASRLQLVKQFIGESTIFSFIGLFIAWILVELFRPVFSTLAGKDIEIEYLDPILILSMLIILIFTGLFSGSYPALILSSFKSVHFLKGEKIQHPGSKSLRNILVIFQFFVSVVLIICTTVIYKQLWYIQNKDLGLNKENILVTPFIGVMAPKYDEIKKDLLRNPNIYYVSGVSNLPTNVIAHVSLDWEGNKNDEGIGIDYMMVDYDLIETMGMEMLYGRSFSEEFADDDSIAYIVNETAYKRMGIENPIGHPIEFQHPYFPGRFSRGEIIGVVKDFHHRPLREYIVPLAMRMYRPWYNHLVIKINPEDIQETISYVQASARKFAPEYPFVYSFFEDEINVLYSSERKIGDIVKYFALLSIFISCLGLFGLASFTAEQYTRQIGIRKVNGASVTSIIFLLIRDFTKWVSFALILGCPVAWVIMKKILANYAYKTEISWWIFLITALLVSFIGLFTMIVQAVKAATRNPADSLRYE
ncbi:MAG: ABC transporter permease [Bacteroidales bacterium]|nr:ABC transporter permease [Bacteroidales bacterium]